MGIVFCRHSLASGVLSANRGWHELLVVLSVCPCSGRRSLRNTGCFRVGVPALSALLPGAAAFARRANAANARSREGRGGPWHVSAADKNSPGTYRAGVPLRVFSAAAVASLAAQRLFLASFPGCGPDVQYQPRSFEGQGLQLEYSSIVVQMNL